MNRNIVGIVGSAGAIERSLRLKVELLAKNLSQAGYDLVTGGEDGVMRAVARGHYRAGRLTELLHIRPGWEADWKRNPYPATVMDTGMGAMRNHLVVRTADVVIAVQGGAGTLSEISIAWGEKKPLASLTGDGGWSEQLAGKQLDKRRQENVESCATVEELVAWVQERCPGGVFTGGLNRGFYPLLVPALHRIRSSSQSNCPIQEVHSRFGMSIAEEDCTARLRLLNDEVAQWNQRHLTQSVGLVTFDDGWKDVMTLVPLFAECEHLRPVLFIGENHFGKSVRPLPLQRLYHHCAGLNCVAGNGEELEAVRKQLKTASEDEQHWLLDEARVPPMHDPEWLLNPDDIEQLRSEGWIIASHGPRHEDLRNATDLADALSRTAEAVEVRGHTPWLAWPEGWWSSESAQVAFDAGFVAQFGLQEEPNEAVMEGMVMRSIWA